MKHLQPKTLQVMVALLNRPDFSQRALWKMCNRTLSISLGQVNKIVMDLEHKGFVEPRFNRPFLTDQKDRSNKTSKKTVPPARITYRLTDPVGLLHYIAYFRSMKELKAFSVRVGASSEALIKELAKEGVIFCLGTAQSRYSPYFRPDEVSFYSTDIERIHGLLMKAPYGDTKIGCYRIDYAPTTKERALLIDDRFAASEGKISYTTKVQTVLDMFCDGKGAYAKPLLNELWGIQL
jgi:hypothetical protein